ncbi:MAG: SDR family NAD(P)-dependent oxidoreductase [Acidobacteriota bacterium]|nr:SDR family NAD(P)-dependent oxidoreductase [Acidobacteriota bacterium]
MEIEGKRVLVTGASRGLGRALALACLTAGAREVLAGVRQPESLKNLKETAKDVRLTPVRLDVTSEDDVRAAADLGRVDILINNAGVSVYGSVLQVPLAELQHEIEVNYLGALLMARAFAPAMIESRDGLIVNVASILAKVNLPALGNYCALKAALLSLSQALRADLRRHGVRVITVLPGTIDTDMSRDFDGPKMSAEQAASEIIEAIRAERIETPIGDAAREVMTGLASDPLAIEMSFAEYRA